MDKQRQKQLQQLAEALLEREGTTYDEWLETQHLDLIAKRSGILTKALKTEPKS